MKITAEKIKEMILLGENSTLEIKESRKKVPSSVWESYSAFANTHGGIILLGITEHKDKPLPERFEITGVEDSFKIITDFFNQLEDPKKVSANILVDSDVRPISIDGKDVICITVPEADYHRKPVYINDNMRDGTYKRSHEGDRHVNKEELAMLTRNSADDLDSEIVEHYGMDDIDPDTLNAYRARFDARYRNHVYGHLDNKQFLQQMGGYSKNRRTGKEGLTKAGLLMFGKGLSIREVFPQFRVDYLDRSGITPGSSEKWNDRLTDDGTWEHNLFNFVALTLRRLFVTLPKAGRLVGGERADDESLKDAVMEGTVNSVIHCDFEANGVLRIERQTEQIVMRNPGNLRISRDKIYQGEFTHARNQTMQRMFRMVGYGDNIGSGFQKILSAWASESWITPDLHEENEVHEVWLTLKLVSLFAPSLLDRLHELYGGSFDLCASEEKEALALIVGGYANTNAKLQQYTGKNSWEVNRLLSGLTSQGFLISTPNGRWTTYDPNPEFVSHINSQINQDANPLDINNKTAVSQLNSQLNSQINSQLNSANEISIPDEILGYLTDDQRQIISEITISRNLTMKDLSEKLGRNYNWLRYQRKLLEKLGIYILQEGSKKTGWWKIQYTKQ